MSEDVVSYVINPETGRQIKVGGPTYAKLLSKYPQLQRLPPAEKKTKSAPKKRHQAHQLSERQIGQRAEMPVFQLDRPADQQLIKKNKEEPRGSRTRGWAQDAPKKGSERHLLKSKCGDKCFLIPATEAFPICPRCESADQESCSCQIDCRGLTAAKIRAKQYKYQELFPAIDRLITEKGCR